MKIEHIALWTKNLDESIAFYKTYFNATANSKYSNPENNFELYAFFTKLSQGVRRIGSAALDLCYTAAGRFDGYWELSLGAWDITAGALIAQEAGAMVSDINGGENFINPPYSILAANRYLHPKMLELIQKNRNSG